jgi:hypothetical protein
LLCGRRALFSCLDDLIDLVGEVIEEDETRTDTGIIDEFRDFIENISPEDFDT